MNAPDRRYRIVAESTAKPGDLILEDLAGERWLFVGSTGTVSRAALRVEVIDALLRLPHWRPRTDSPWLTLDELRAARRDAGYRGGLRFLRGLMTAPARVERYARP